MNAMTPDDIALSVDLDLHRHTITFANPNAKIPVKTKGEHRIFLPWGRRCNERGELPIGSHIHLAHIHAGVWDRFFPVPVKCVDISHFRLVDLYGVGHWFTLPGGKWIQGLVARAKTEQRVYLVSLAYDLDQRPFDYWPRILAGN